MKVFIFIGKDDAQFIDKPKPQVLKPSDAVVRLVKTTICDTDLHIIKGEVPEVMSGTILGHEGVGSVEEVGLVVINFKKGDRVLISCICSCGKCYYCKKEFMHIVKMKEAGCTVI